MQTHRSTGRACVAPVNSNVVLPESPTKIEIENQIRGAVRAMGPGLLLFIVCAALSLVPYFVLLAGLPAVLGAFLAVFGLSVRGELAFRTKAIGIVVVLLVFGLWVGAMSLQ